MSVIAYIVPTAYWLALIPAAVAVSWLSAVVTKRVKYRRASSHSAPILRLYESMLLTACAGDKTEVRRLIADEIKRRPKISRVDAARRAHDRLKKQARYDVWRERHAF